MANRVLTDVEGRIATVTVNRPEKRNAMDVPTRRDLRTAFEDVVADDDVRVIVLRGAGEGQFIAGGDLETFTEFDMLDAMAYLEEHAQGLYNYVATVPTPTVAAMDGYAYGGGLEVACACDLRVAREGISMGVPEVSLGILPAGGGTQRLASLIGGSRATDLVITGRTLGAEEAHDIGLVNRLYAEEDFEAGVAEVAETLAGNAPVAMRLAKQSVNRALDMEAGLDFERVAGTLLFGTEDKQEGAEAFLEGREPAFRGR